MKTRFNSFLTVLVILMMTSVAGFSQEKKVDLRSPEVQKEVFNQILTDHQLMMNFMEQMNKSENAMKMMMGNMMNCCNADSSTCKDMSAIVAEHDKVLQQMGKYLDEKEDSKYVVRERKYKHR